MKKYTVEDKWTVWHEIEKILFFEDPKTFDNGFSIWTDGRVVSERALKILAKHGIQVKTADIPVKMEEKDGIHGPFSLDGKGIIVLHRDYFKAPKNKVRLWYIEEEDIEKLLTKRRVRDFIRKL